jgi:hypothetical protein
VEGPLSPAMCGFLDSVGHTRMVEEQLTPTSRAS